MLKGNAKPTFPDGPANTVAVVQQGPVTNLGNGAGGYIPIAFRNNTSKAISHVDWTGVAKVGGKIVSTGQSQGTDPAQIEPGAVGLSFIFFSTKVPPPNAAFTFSEESMEADKSSFNTASLRVTQANKSGDGISGEASNDTGAKLSGPYAVNIYCFEDGKIAKAITAGFTDQQGDLAPKARATFSVTLYDKCDNYMVGVSGYFA